MDTMQENHDSSNRDEGTIVVKPNFNTKELKYGGNYVFCLMPFKDEFTELYKDKIKPAVELDKDYSLECFRADEITRPGKGIMEKVWLQIFGALFLIVELSTLNPNVFYELGIADVLGKESILLWNQEQGRRIPFDIGHREAIYYSPTEEGYTDLVKKLKFSIAAIMAAIHSQRRRPEFKSVGTIYESLASKAD